MLNAHNILLKIEKLLNDERNGVSRVIKEDRFSLISVEKYDPRFLHHFALLHCSRLIQKWKFGRCYEIEHLLHFLIRFLHRRVSFYFVYTDPARGILILRAIVAPYTYVVSCPNFCVSNWKAEDINEIT